MPGDKKPTNLFLLLIAVLLCIGSAGVFTRSSGIPSRIQNGTTELSASAGVNEPATGTDSISGDADQEDSSEDTETVSDEAVTPTAAPSATPSPAPAVRDVSPEAESGIWTSSGNKWMFMVNGTPYTGWLNDLDGKCYYFNSDGIMQTGWVDYEGKRYYFDLDGIMQTGFITVEGKSYELLSDGSLKNYTPEPTSTPAPTPEATVQPTSEQPAQDASDAAA